MSILIYRQACVTDIYIAFGSPDHVILMTKLYEICFRCEVNTCWSSYLDDRVHYICISRKTTSCLTIETGMQQGSILGPLLFLLYINGTTKCDINCSIALLADDTSSLKTNRSLSNWIHVKSCLSVQENQTKSN